ncbi:MAG: phosphate-starvation-inducible PsiE family protein [Candidatus Nanohaloarchaeota archaeon QJJ-5]|nr:phosphate-starvation-inducible PsiE family protein [Candidatus Nanohaloarchaeota archaeon QJJ-5]
MADEDHSLTARYISLTQRLLDGLVMVFGVILIGIFGLLLISSVRQLVVVMASSDPFSSAQILGVIDTVLLSLIVVEVFRNLTAYLKGISVIPIIIDVAILAIGREIIALRVLNTSDAMDVFLYSAAYSILLGVLLAGHYLIKVKEPREELQDATDQVI